MVLIYTNWMYARDSTTEIHHFPWRLRYSIWSSFKLNKRICSGHALVSHQLLIYTLLIHMYIPSDTYSLLLGHVLENSSLFYIEWIFSFISSLKIVAVFLDRIERIPLDSLAVDTGCASLWYAIHQFMIQQCMIHA